MKRMTALALAAALTLSLAACGSAGGENGSAATAPGSAVPSAAPSGVSTPEVEYHQLGETVATDIFEFTLEDGSFAIALSNMVNETRFTPKEYDPAADANNPYVAPKGHTFAAFTYTVTNLDRTSGEFHSGSFASVEYDGETYNAMEEGAYYPYQDSVYLDADGDMQTEKAGEWYGSPPSNLLLGAGEKETRRAYVDVAVDVADLTETFYLTVQIPSSDGTQASFVYEVSEAGRQTVAQAAQAEADAEQAAVAPIEEALQGAWVHETTTVTFADGRFSYDYIKVSDGQRDISEGDYEIGEDSILLHYDSGAETELPYTYAEGVLTLIGRKGGVDFNYIKQ